MSWRPVLPLWTAGRAREVRRTIWREAGVTHRPLNAQSYKNERRRVAVL
jgi:hypothetical protein